jgi:hypothetical protein
VLLFFSVARSQDNSSWERATEVSNAKAASAKASSAKTKAASKTAGGSGSFGTNMPLMSSAFDTAMWLNVA